MGGNSGLLTAVLESMDQGVVVVDDALTLVLCNVKWREMFRLPRDVTRAGTPWEAVVRHRVVSDARVSGEEGTTDMEERIAAIMRTARTCGRQPHTYEVRLPEGRVISVQSNPLPEGGFVRTFTDITDDRATEDHLRLMQERYALALRSANEGLYDWDILRGTIFFSDRLQELFGLPGGVLTPEEWCARILPEDFPIYRNTHVAHLKRHTDRFVCEYRMRAGDGRVVWVRQHGIALRDATGRAIRLTGSVGDVTEYKVASQALRDSEERHALAMQSINEGVYDWEVASGRVHLTERLREMLGLDRDLLPADDWTARVHPADADTFRLSMRALLKGEVSRLEVEYRIDTGNGQWRWFRQHGVAVRDDATGRALRIIGSTGDITDRKETQRALLASQEELARERELLKATLENMDQGIFMADARQNLVAWNYRFQEMFDLPDSLFAQPVPLSRLMAHLVERGDIRMDMEAARERYLGDTACNTAQVTEVRRPNGQVLETRNVPLADGSFVRTFTDVTERKRAEDAVRELIEAMPLPLVVSSLSEHRYLYVNDHAHRAFGVSTDPEFAGSRSVMDVYVDPQDRLRLAKRLSKEGRVDGFEAELRTPNGPQWVLMSARIVDYQGTRAAVVASSIITERKHLERDLKSAKERAEKALADLQDAQQNLIEAEKMASLGGLVAGVAHEINTPVGITLTTATHLQEKTKELRRVFEAGTIRKTDFAQYMGVADNACALLVSNATRAANLIQSFKQVAVDQTSDERRAFDLREYVDEVLLSLGPRLKRTPFKVAVDVPEGIVVDSYPGPLSQVLTNFIMNSLIHGLDGMDSGGMSVRARLVDGGMVEIAYADTGKGIDRANLKRIFEPFFTTKRGEGGSGLGLNIVYNIVTQKLKGTIKAESDLGRGATFTLCIPLRIPAPTQSQTQSRENRPAPLQPALAGGV
ncbi:PAS-domain containing protein [Novispirillum sp. DQ9]|uniref:PAS-domain containing protein n=1 Tax=Novispirillum sp. DQ9 TaxID=3398612 RepID=UPI003C7DE37D